MGITGPLTCEEVKEYIRGENQDITYFVETGTYKAQTTLEMAKIFITYSIELSAPLYHEAYVKCQGNKNVQLFHGDSIKLLPIITTWIDSKDQKAVWFIDAHQSGPDTTNNGELVPLFAEIELILNHIKEPAGHVFILDDARLFDAFDDWKGINTDTILNKFRQYSGVKKSFLHNDRFIVILGEKDTPSIDE
jgi:hypothetical protein